MFFLLIVTYSCNCISDDSGNTILEDKNTVIKEKFAKSWTFPNIQGDGQVILEFKARINCPTIYGWNPSCIIKMNDTSVLSMADRKNARLINKPESFTHSMWGKSTWCRTDRWIVLYAPDFDSGKDKFNIPGDEVYRFCLDVTDIVSKTSENKLSIRFAADIVNHFKTAGMTGFSPDLIISDLKIIEKKDTQSKLTERKSLLSYAYVKMKKIPHAEYALDVSKDGAVNLKISNLSIPVASYFSAPGGKSFSWGGENHNGWKIEQSVSERGLQVSSENEYYSISREIRREKNRIDIYDSIKNKTPALIGIKVRYEIDTAVNSAFNSIYLAGDDTPNIKEKSGGRNPSVFLASSKNNTGVGLIAQDDVFRVQNIQYCKDEKAGIRSDTFALSPGEARTVEWSIYMTPSNDYYDFVNSVRRDWDVNFTIDGGFSLSLNMYAEYDKEKAGRHTDNLGLTAETLCVLYGKFLKDSRYNKLVLTGAALMDDLARDSDGAVLETAPMRTYVKEILAKAKKLSPQLKRFLYVHNQLSVEKDDNIRYADCKVTDSNNKPQFFDEKKYLGIFCPTVNNEYGKHFYEYIDWLCDNFDIEGLYHDEFTHSKTPLTYSMWDKVSVTMDSQNNVKQKIGFVPLIKLDFNMKLAEHIMKDRKKTFITNFAPETRTERKLKFTRFEEVYDSSWACWAHLYTPVVLGDMWVYKSGECLEDIRERLKRGCLYYHYHLSTPYPTITSKMFPFTPVEIHGGWMLGEERILTLFSGEYGWMNKNYLAYPYVYDEKGKEIENYPYEILFSKDGTRIKLHLENDYCSSIVKLPVEVFPETQDIAVSQLNLSQERFGFMLKGSGTVKIVLDKEEEGKWLLKDGINIAGTQSEAKIFIIKVQGEKYITFERNNLIKQ